jgi:hypothetical protein
MPGARPELYEISVAFYKKADFYNTGQLLSSYCGFEGIEVQIPGWLSGDALTVQPTELLTTSQNLSIAVGFGCRQSSHNRILEREHEHRKDT